ncbi:MAG: hypothetical protein DI603_14795 [Roseateles depolymerans]|uniref:Prepilin-type cleavage/methylation domain-containing protein n=1 Tax=Roseateles depolymerans TaxID=76731 RepID=A0A2W5DER2_9BURK|nr:MAG: hypothetical protein DI603_14795 [Roseateles depolymerans]
MNKQAGLSLIQVVIALVVLGLVSALAMPQFASASDEARQSALNEVAGALSSASAINYANRKAHGDRGIRVADCADIAATLPGGLPEARYQITAAAISPDSTVTNCVVSSKGKQAMFTATGVL